jgi:O-Antigen ligase
VLVPLRLRAAATVAVGGIAAAAVVGWAYRTPSLIDDHVALAARSAAGHRLGVGLVLALLAAYAVALLARFASDRHPPGALARRRAGVALIVCLALVPVAGVAALAHSSRGLGGSISHAWDSLTNPNAAQATTNPGRLTTISNNHTLYWSYAVRIFDTSPVLGAGAGSFPIADQRFQTGPAIALQTHSYVFQTLADLGILGLLISVGLAGAWLVAARRAVGPLGPRAPGAGAAERIGLVTMVAIVVVFTVDSAIDRSWFVPTDAVIALLCAGWVAGRGSHTEALRRARPSFAALRSSPAAACGAVIAVAIGLAIAWAQWQPLRSEQAASAGAIALGNSNSYGIPAAQRARLLATARADELTAISRDPLDILPLSYLGLTYEQLGRNRLAAAMFEREVTLAPSDAQSWIDLGTYYLGLSDSARAQSALESALYLGRWIPTLNKLYIESLRS